MGGGTEVTTDELLAEYESVKEFMRGGGITCTGGEPTLQMDFLTELFRGRKNDQGKRCNGVAGLLEFVV